MADLNLNGIQDQAVRDNFKILQDSINGGNGLSQMQLCEIFVTSNVVGLKIAVKSVGVPSDAIITRLIAPSAARLTFVFSEFTKEAVLVNVSGLSDGEVLYARFLVGTLTSVVSIGTVVHASSETQQVRSKF